MTLKRLIATFLDASSSAKTHGSFSTRIVLADSSSHNLRKNQLFTYVVPVTMCFTTIFSIHENVYVCGKYVRSSVPDSQTCAQYGDNKETPNVVVKHIVINFTSSLYGILTTFE